MGDLPASIQDVWKTGTNTARTPAPHGAVCAGFRRFACLHSRSIRPGQHFLEFWNTTVRADGGRGGSRLLGIEEDVYGAVEAARALEQTSPGRIHGMVRNSQQFAAK